MPTAGDVVEVVVAGGFTAWFIVEALVLWAQRPPVVFVDGHWRAQRGIQHHQRVPARHVRLRPVSHLRVARPLAS